MSFTSKSKAVPLWHCTHFTHRFANATLTLNVSISFRIIEPYTFMPISLKHCYPRHPPLLNLFRRIGPATCQTKLANLPNSLWRLCNCRPMPLGPTQLRRCGDGCGRQSYICTGSVRTGRHFKTKSLPSWNSLKTGHRNYCTMSDYYRINKLIFIKPPRIVTARNSAYQMKDR